MVYYCSWCFFTQYSWTPVEIFSGWMFLGNTILRLPHTEYNGSENEDCSKAERLAICSHAGAPKDAYCDGVVWPRKLGFFSLLITQVETEVPCMRTAVDYR